MRKSVFVAALLGAMAFVGAAYAKSSCAVGGREGEAHAERTPREAANLALVLEMFDAVLGKMDASAVDRYVRPDYIQHGSMAETGSMGLKKFINSQKGQWENVVHDVKRCFVDGDYVILHTHVTRHRGDPGFAVMDVMRVQDGMIAEHWDTIQPMPDKLLHSNGVF